MKKSELRQIIREEIQNHLVEASENDLLKILRKGITNGLDKIYGSSELKNATKGPSNMIPKALYHSGSVGITFRPVYSKTNLKLYLLHINYPTSIYDKAKHKRFVNWVEIILKKNKFVFKNEEDAVGTSNAVLEYYIQHPNIVKENIKNNLLEVEVSTSKFEFSHGKKPKGDGGWIFKIGSEEWEAPGRLPYGKAVSKAKAYAKQKGAYSIEVMP